MHTVSQCCRHHGDVIRNRVLAGSRRCKVRSPYMQFTSPNSPIRMHQRYTDRPGTPAAGARHGTQSVRTNPRFNSVHPAGRPHSMNHIYCVSMLPMIVRSSRRRRHDATLRYKCTRAADRSLLIAERSDDRRRTDERTPRASVPKNVLARGTVSGVRCIDHDCLDHVVAGRAERRSTCDSSVTPPYKE